MSKWLLGFLTIVLMINSAGCTGAAEKPAEAKPNPAGEVRANLWTRKKGVDWTQFLGPTGDSKSPETGILTQWPRQGPRIVWQRRLGISYGIGSVSNGRL